MTQLRHDAAYIRTEPGGNLPTSLTAFDETVYETLRTPHTVVSASKALSSRSPDHQPADLEARVADSMLRLLQAERIELSPDS